MPFEESRSLFIVFTTAVPCGAEDFALKMAAALKRCGSACGNSLLKISGRWSDLTTALSKMRKAERIVFNLPLVAWKRTILLSWVLLLFAFGQHQQIFVFLHEWSNLHPLRRLVLMPFILFSKTIVIPSPYIREQLAVDRWAGWAECKCELALHAPTVKRPSERLVSDTVRQVEKLRAEKNVLIGHFGSIYKGKGTDALLDICTYFRGRGVDASVVFIEGMIKSLNDYESILRYEVECLKLALSEFCVVSAAIWRASWVF